MEKEKNKKETRKKESLYYSAADIQEMLEDSRSVAYKLLRQLTAELEEQGYIVIPGRVPKKSFAEHIYGMAQ